MVTGSKNPSNLGKWFPFYQHLFFHPLHCAALAELSSSAILATCTREVLMEGEEIPLLGRNEPWGVTFSGCTGGEKSCGASLGSPRECPVPRALVLRQGLISQSSSRDAFESCPPCVRCTLCLLLVGLSNKGEDEPPVPVVKKAEEFFHPRATEVHVLSCSYPSFKPSCCRSTQGREHYICKRQATGLQQAEPKPTDRQKEPAGLNFRAIK